MRGTRDQIGRLDTVEDREFKLGNITCTWAKTRQGVQVRLVTVIAKRQAESGEDRDQDVEYHSNGDESAPDEELSSEQEPLTEQELGYIEEKYNETKDKLKGIVTVSILMLNFIVYLGNSNQKQVHFAGFRR